jgi:hypothetical protein
MVAAWSTSPVSPCCSLRRICRVQDSHLLIVLLQDAPGRDLKLENILLTKMAPPEVKLADPAIAKVRAETCTPKACGAFS